MVDLIAIVLNEVMSIGDFKLSFEEKNIQKMFRNEIIVNLIILIPLIPFLAPILDIFGKIRLMMALYGI